MGNLHLNAIAAAKKIVDTIEHTEARHLSWSGSKWSNADVYDLARSYLKLHDNPALLLCTICSNPATCFCFATDGEERLECYCDEHCGHGGEDGHCTPIDKLVSDVSAILRERET
jgi:hypothetical protein